MASLTNTGPSAGARWTLAALLRRLQPTGRPRRIQTVVTAEAAEVETSARRARRHSVSKRHSVPQRDAVFERSAMAREMFRL